MSRLGDHIHSFLTADVTEKLFKRKIYTALSFVETDPELIVKICGLQYTKVLQVRNAILTKFSSPLISGHALYSEIIAQSAIIKSGIDNLDTLIDGGFITGNIYEVCGASASGKTQIFMTIAVNVCASHKDQSVLYVDTKNDVSAQRILEILEKGDRKSEDAGKLMSRIKIVHVHHVDHLLRFLHRLSKDFQQGKTLGFRILIVDSLPALFFRFSGEDRLALLNEVANLLRFIAVEYHVVILVSNLVSKWTSDELEDAVQMQTPLLGKYWLHIPNTRITLQKMGNQLLLITTKSSNQPIGKTAQVTIDEKGVT